MLPEMIEMLGINRALELTEGLLTFDGAAADLLRRLHGKADPGYLGSSEDFDRGSRSSASDRVAGLGHGAGQSLEKDEV
jgi:hypothetical protein